MTDKQIDEAKEALRRLIRDEYISSDDAERDEFIVFEALERQRRKEWVVWIEPFGPNNEPVYCKVPQSTAIAVMKKKATDAGYPWAYPNDKEAVKDFMAVHWAWLGDPEDDPDLEKVGEVPE